MKAKQRDLAEFVTPARNNQLTREQIEAISIDWGTNLRDIMLRHYAKEVDELKQSLNNRRWDWTRSRDIIAKSKQWALKNFHGRLSPAVWETFIDTMSDAETSQAVLRRNETGLNDARSTSVSSDYVGRVTVTSPHFSVNRFQILSDADDDTEPVNDHSEEVSRETTPKEQRPALRRHDPRSKSNSLSPPLGQRTQPETSNRNVGVHNSPAGENSPTFSTVSSLLMREQSPNGANTTTAVRAARGACSSSPSFICLDVEAPETRRSGATSTTHNGWKLRERPSMKIERDGVKCIIIGDSNLRNVSTSHFDNDTDIQCFPGATLTNCIDILENSSHVKTDCMILSVGINDKHNDNMNFLTTLRKLKFSADKIGKKVLFKLVDINNRRPSTEISNIARLNKEAKNTFGIAYCIPNLPNFHTGRDQVHWSRQTASDFTSTIKTFLNYQHLELQRA